MRVFVILTHGIWNDTVFLYYQQVFLQIILDYWGLKQ